MSERRPLLARSNSRAQQAPGYAALFEHSEPGDSLAGSAMPDGQPAALKQRAKWSDSASAGPAAPRPHTPQIAVDEADVGVTFATTTTATPQTSAHHLAVAPAASPSPPRTPVESELSPWQALGLFFAWPLWKDAVFKNQTSEARDFDAVERNYLSMNKISVSLAMAAGFCLLNLRFDDGILAIDAAVNSSLTYALGIIFAVLGILCTLTSLVNYSNMVYGVAAEKSFVKNLLFSEVLVFLIAGSIIAANVVLWFYNT